MKRFLQSLFSSRKSSRAATPRRTSLLLEALQDRLLLSANPGLTFTDLGVDISTAPALASSDSTTPQSPFNTDLARLVAVSPEELSTLLSYYAAQNGSGASNTPVTILDSVVQWESLPVPESLSDASATLAVSPETAYQGVPVPLSEQIILQASQVVAQTVPVLTSFEQTTESVTTSFRVDERVLTSVDDSTVVIRIAHRGADTSLIGMGDRVIGVYQSDRGAYMTPDGVRVAIPGLARVEIDQRDGLETLIINGQEVAAYQHLTNVQVSTDGQHFSFIATQNGRQVAVIDGQVAVAHTFIGDREVSAYDEITSFQVSADGSSCWLNGRTGDTLYIVEHGVAYESRVRQTQEQPALNTTPLDTFGRPIPQFNGNTTPLDTFGRPIPNFNGNTTALDTNNQPIPQFDGPVVGSNLTPPGNPFFDSAAVQQQIKADVRQMLLNDGVGAVQTIGDLYRLGQIDPQDATDSPEQQRKPQLPLPLQEPGQFNLTDLQFTTPVPGSTIPETLRDGTPVKGLAPRINTTDAPTGGMELGGDPTERIPDYALIDLTDLAHTTSTGDGAEPEVRGGAVPQINDRVSPTDRIREDLLRSLTDLPVPPAIPLPLPKPDVSQQPAATPTAGAVVAGPGGSVPYGFLLTGPGGSVPYNSLILEELLAGPGGSVPYDHLFGDPIVDDLAQAGGLGGGEPV